MSDQDPDTQRLEADSKPIEAMRDQLLEHWDSVAIFVTRYRGGDDGGTDRVYVGGGNWFARYGQIRSWLIQEDELTRRREDRPDV